MQSNVTRIVAIVAQMRTQSGKAASFSLSSLDFVFVDVVVVVVVVVAVTFVPD